MIKDILMCVVKKFWKIFVVEGLKQPILSFEFSIDTGSHTPYFCKKYKYRPNEGKVIMKHIQKILGLKWVEECTNGGWYSPIVLASTSH